MNIAYLDMNNPLSPVRNVRESYSRFLQRIVTEVEVQFKDEEPAWIPYETLLAMMDNESAVSYTHLTLPTN